MQRGMETRDTPTLNVLGVRFNRLTTKQAVEQILHWIEERSRRMVITAGPEFVMMAMRSEQIKQIANVADLVTPDGIGIVWAARRQGKVVESRVTGVELVQELLASAEQRGQSLRVYVLGAKEASLQECLAEFRNMYPQQTFMGRNGYFRPADTADLIRNIEAFEPHLLLVGLGQPAQERFIFEWLGALPPCVAVGVGGSIDVWSGTVKRAPTVIRKLNLEWLYRLLKQPSRWRRQLALPRFAWQVLKNTDRRG